MSPEEHMSLALAQVETLKTERFVHVVRAVEHIVADREELIADLRARLSHAEAERDAALMAASVNRAMNRPETDD